MRPATAASGPPSHACWRPPAVTARLRPVVRPAVWCTPGTVLLLCRRLRQAAAQAVQVQPRQNDLIELRRLRLR